MQQPEVGTTGIMAPMFTHRFPAPGVLLLVALAAGCAAPGPRAPSEPTEPAALASAGRHVEAAEAWLARARANPDRAFDARVNAAAQWLAAGRLAEARALIDELSPAAPDRAAEAELTLLRAELALALRDFETAERLLAGWDADVPPELRARFDGLRQRLAQSDPDSPRARVEALADALSDPAFEPQTALALLIELPTGTLATLADEFADRPALVPWLDLAGRVRPRLTDDPALRRVLADWRSRYGFEAGLVDPLHDWIRAWRETRPLPDSIAVLLPGDGALARVGGVLRDGLIDGWLDIAPGRRPALDFRYVADRPDAAARAWEQATAAGARFVIGPLPRDQVAAVIDAADASARTLLLNRPVDPAALPSRARPVAVLALPPEEEAELAALRALVREHERALVVAEDSDYGRRVADRFAETFTLGGGRVLERAAYARDTFDHTEVLAGLLDVDRSQARIDTLRALLDADFEAVPQRRTDFDLVFIAARGGDGLQLMPQLRFFGVESLPVYATSDIYPGGDVGSDLDGVQFPAPPWLLAEGEAAERRRRAEALYPALADAPTPSTLYALGRDAIALVPWFDALKRDPALYLAGNVGRLRLADGVLLERDLPWARVEAGQPVRYVPEAAD
jgi:hypothetical protein